MTRPVNSYVNNTKTIKQTDYQSIINDKAFLGYPSLYQSTLPHGRQASTPTVVIGYRNAVATADWSTILSIDFVMARSAYTSPISNQQCCYLEL